MSFSKDSHPKKQPKRGVLPYCESITFCKRLVPLLLLVEHVEELHELRLGALEVQLDAGVQLLGP